MDEIRSDAVYRSRSPLSQGIRHGDTVYVSGQVPKDEHGTLVDGDLGTQTEQVLDNVEAVLNETGLTLANVVKATVFLTDMTAFDAFNAVYERRFPDPKPARSAVAVADLAVDADVEIEVIAVVE